MFLQNLYFIPFFGLSDILDSEFWILDSIEFSDREKSFQCFFLGIFCDETDGRISEEYYENYDEDQDR